MDNPWSPFSWQRYTSRHLPTYEDKQALERILEALQSYPPLVLPDFIKAFQEQLAAAAEGKAFLVQGGDCAENLLLPPAAIRPTLSVLHRAKALFSIPVLLSVRGAGQFAKPRSEPNEKRGDTVLPAYRGDGINAIEFSAEARTPDPERMGAMVAYAQQCLPIIEEAGIYTAHEALLLPYEAALTRSMNNQYMATSGHFLWLGDRTRSLSSPHVEFLRGIANPIGIKCGTTLDGHALIELLDVLNPHKIPGRITLIVRLGDSISRRLPLLIAAVKRSMHPVLWCSDPMHGNTVVMRDVKTRFIAAIKEEISAFFHICRQQDVIAGGVHLELTGHPVVECLRDAADEASLAEHYKSLCDPRLNESQALDVLQYVSKHLPSAFEISFG